MSNPKVPLRAQFNNSWIVEFNGTLNGYPFLGVWINDRLYIFFNDVHILTMPYGTPYGEVINAIYMLINRYDNNHISKRAIIKIMVPPGSVDSILANCDRD